MSNAINYNNLQKGVRETTEYLELFTAWRKQASAKQDDAHQWRTEKTVYWTAKQYIESAKQYIDKMVAGGLTKKRRQTQ